MSLFTNSFRKLSQQQQENDSVKVYFKTDMKHYVKIRYNRGTTISQIINELIKELNLNGKLEYQIYIITHKKNEPSLGGISIKRKLRKQEQPFKILFFTKSFKFSFYLDYMLSQLSQNIQDSHFNQIENYLFTKYDKEFQILKVTKNGTYKQIKIKINSQGAALCQEGSIQELFQLDKRWKNLFSTLIVNLILKMTLYLQSLKNKQAFIELQIKMSFMRCKNDYNCSNKLIFSYTKNTEIKCKMNNQDNSIEYCTRQFMEKIEFNCYEFTQSKQIMKQSKNFQSFLEIHKIIQVTKDISALENDDLSIDFGQYRDSILETLSILPREQFRQKLIAFNSEYTYIASCKIVNQIEENNRLHNPLDEIQVREENIRKQSQLLS
ncbi:unnamed protein product [Paramecium sonneborni]|uniref:Uncharacterized protein n=1 Tax=Paramecium sonneborni TaxID=65129 RepID=A0A8S1MP07_9CILI|nr:unnamed protein product [Paramecium sonneborni]